MGSFEPRAPRPPAGRGSAPLTPSAPSASLPLPCPAGKPPLLGLPSLRPPTLLGTTSRHPLTGGIGATVR
eukprot:3019522-Lingulodinium_polyedra.AAC.1